MSRAKRPTSRNHAAKCHPLRADAEQLRNAQRERYQVRANGRYMRWRVRACVECGGYYVTSEMKRDHAAST